ncbi:hypothetical protein [Nocardia abscessus]|uniref:hypothetical protein n=1 Tax=Nocardia abscessus TaxID=120957 RepID=UPI0024586195|nr:hypothetical protein [Nocardia abscessus]
MNFADVMAEARRFHDHLPGEKHHTPGRYNQDLWVAITTNQQGWGGPIDPNAKLGMIVSYARGQVQYARAPLPKHPWTQMWDRLETSRGTGLKYVFDNRVNSWPAEPGQLGGPRQPFNTRQADSLGFEISGDPVKPTATFTLRSWGNAKFEVPLTSMGGILVGTGPAIGNAAGIDKAVYTVAFEISYSHNL